MTYAKVSGGSSSGGWQRFWRTAGPPALVTAVAALGAAEGCGGGGTTGTGGTSHAASSTGGASTSSSGVTTSSSTGTGGMTTASSSTGTGGMGGMPPAFTGTVTQVGKGALMFDAVPDPTGKTVYITGVDATKGPGVLSVPADGSNMTPATVQAGAPFVAPFGIVTSSDGTKLYVADPGADGGNDKGQIWSLPTGGGMPTAVMGATDYRSRSLDLVVQGGADTLYFTGTDATNGKVGVFKLLAAGGTVSTVVEGAPFVDPSGIAVAPDGSIYVSDTIAPGTGQAAIIKIDTAMTTSTVTTVQVGYPAGIGVVLDGTLLASTTDPAKYTDVILHITPGTPPQTTPITMGVGALTEAAGLHRSQKLNTFAFVDGGSTGPMSGQVFVVK